MTIGVWLTLLGVLVMVLGPVMLLQPSTRDRRLNELRGGAQERGVKVTMQTLPSQATDLGDPDLVPVYRLPAAKGGGPTRSWMLVRGVYQHEAHFLGDWVWQGRERASAEEQDCLTALLPGLPKSVRAVAGDAAGWSIYWMELGGDDALQTVLDGLVKLRDCKRPPASALH